MRIPGFVASVTALLSVVLLTAVKGENEASMKKFFSVYPIGTVKKSAGRTTIVLDAKYQPGLLGLEGFSHIHVLYWFDRNDTPEKRSTLQVHPRGNRKNPLSGVFATRSPARPNLIGLSLCKIIEVRDNVVEIDRIDAFDDTPVLDIKPYIYGTDAAEARHPDWISHEPDAHNGCSRRGSSTPAIQRARDARVQPPGIRRQTL